MLKKIVYFLILVTIFGAGTAGFDYYRMLSGTEPLFNISRYDQNTKIENYRGLFYQASRKTLVSEHESLTDSKDITFTIVGYKIDVPSQFKEVELDMTMSITEDKSCDNISKLYYADKDIKVYTYCLENIDINKDNKNDTLISYLKKDNTIIEDVLFKMSFMGLQSDMSSEYYKSSYNFSNSDVVIYRCNKENINDIYIGPGTMTFMSDFCTYKDDDFKFMYEIVEEEIADGVEVPEGVEVFYEDEVNRYEFDSKKSDRIFITTPAVRGKVETKTPLMTILNYNILTIDELKEKGLEFNTINKEEERVRLEKEAQEALEKQQQAANENTEQVQ